MTILARGGAKKRASCEVKTTAELLSLLRSWHWGLNRAMQSFKRS